MTMVEFDTVVLERSRTVPVVVDFWAAWCAPCRTLGPIVEALEEQAGGRWELVKVDVDEQPELAQRFGVRGIPAVKMFRDGEVVAEFAGALPAGEVRRWLDQSLPDPRRNELARLVAGWESRGPEIVPELEAIVEAHADLPAARLRLAQAVVGRDAARARRLLRETGSDAELEALAADVSALADLMETGGDLPPRIAPHVEGAKSCLAAHDLDGALRHLVELAMLEREFGDGLARRASVALFDLLGQDHDLTREHRKRLAMALLA